MSHQFTGSQTEDLFVAVSTSFTVMVQCNLKATRKSCRATKIVDLPGVSTCHATSFELPVTYSPQLETRYYFAKNDVKIMFPIIF